MQGMWLRGVTIIVWAGAAVVFSGESLIRRTIPNRAS